MQHTEINIQRTRLAEALNPPAYATIATQDMSDRAFCNAVETLIEKAGFPRLPELPVKECRVAAQESVCKQLTGMAMVNQLFELRQQQAKQVCEAHS